MKKLIAVASVVAIGAALTAGMAFARNQGSARVRVVHASPDAPTVDVLVNDTVRAFTGASFEGVTGYATLPAGVYNFKVVPAGETAGEAVVDVNQSLFTHQDYTVVAVDVLGSIEALLLLDDNRPVRKGLARVGFVHASPDAPRVDIAVVNGPVLFDDIEFKEAGGYIEVPRGTYDLEVRLSSNGNVALDLPGVVLEGGTTYTIYAMGLATGQPGLRAVISRDSTRKTR